jgi:hypothetical protein
VHQTRSISSGRAMSWRWSPSNPIDPNAVLVTADGTRLGWVPNPLLTYVRAVVSLPNARLIVVRANPRELGHHMQSGGIGQSKAHLGRRLKGQECPATGGPFLDD